MPGADCWLVTGAARGIGLALAAAHLARGGRVLASHRGPVPETLAARAAAWPDALALLEFDLRDPGAVARAARTAQEMPGPVDVLVNNAGIYGPKTPGLAGLDRAAALEAFDVNALGPLRVIEAFLPVMAGARRPRIVAVSSLMGAVSKPGRGSLAYRMSKAALNRAMQAVAEELAPQGIAVACLRPGHVRTDMTGPAAPMTPEESAAGLLAVIDGLKAKPRAQFLDVTGAALDW